MQLGLLCFLQQKQKGWELLGRLLCVSCFKVKKSWHCRKECSTENLNTIWDRVPYFLSPLLVPFQCYLTVPSLSPQCLPASLDTRAAPTSLSNQPQKSPALLFCQTCLSTCTSPLSPSQWTTWTSHAPCSSLLRSALAQRQWRDQTGSMAIGGGGCPLTDFSLGRSLIGLSGPVTTTDHVPDLLFPHKQLSVFVLKDTARTWATLLKNSPSTALEKGWKEHAQWKARAVEALKTDFIPPFF